MLKFDSEVLNSVLKFVRGKRPLTAILGFFANVELQQLPPDLLSNVFKAMISSEDEGVWHRGLYILSEHQEHQSLTQTNVTKDDVQT